MSLPIVDTPAEPTLPTPTITTNSITFAGGNVNDVDAASGFNYNISYIIKDTSGNIVPANSLSPATQYTWTMQYNAWNKATNSLIVNEKTTPQAFTTLAAGVDAPTTVTLTATGITTTSILAACNILDANGAEGRCTIRSANGTLVSSWAI